MFFVTLIRFWSCMGPLGVGWLTTGGIFLFHHILFIIFSILILHVPQTLEHGKCSIKRGKKTGHRSLSVRIHLAALQLLHNQIFALSTGINPHRPSYIFGLHLLLLLLFPLPEIISCPTELSKNFHIGFQGCCGSTVSRLDLPLCLLFHWKGPFDEIIYPYSSWIKNATNTLLSPFMGDYQMVGARLICNPGESLAK